MKGPAGGAPFGHGRPRAVMHPPHMLPEFFDVVGRGHAIKSRLDIIGQCVIGKMHVGEFGTAKRLTVAVRDADAVKHVHKTRHLAIRHVGVLVLTGIRTADIFAVLPEV